IDADQTARKILRRDEIEQRRKAVRGRLVEVAADGDSRARRYRADVLDDAIERPLAAAKRPHPIVRLAIAVERDLDAAKTARLQPVDDILGQQETVGD